MSSSNALTDWLRAFQLLHERAKARSLTEEEAGTYGRSRDELAEAMLLAQQLNLKPGEAMRKTIRISKACPAELVMPWGRVSAVTLDLSTGGFSTLVSDAPESGSELQFKLRLSRTLDPVVGTAKVVGRVPLKGSVRLGLMFEQVPAGDRERLEFVILDAILQQFGF
jgi:hypothetical protein